MRVGDSWWSCIAAIVAVLGCYSHAKAAYVLTPLVGGASQVSVAPGQSFQVDYWLTSDASDTHDSAIFQVELSSPGLILTSISWSSPYEASLDGSTPLITSLPALINANTLDGPAFPNGVADFELSNVSFAGSFTTGLLVSTVIQVPASGLSTDSITLTIVPDTMALGFDQKHTTSGLPLAITVIPTPTTFAIAMSGVVVCGRRTRAPRNL